MFRTLLLVGILVIWSFAALPAARAGDGPRDAGAVRGDAVGSRSTTPKQDDEGPVAVPEPSEKALRYYRSGMWIWAFGECWALIVPMVIAFSGLSVRLRDLAQRLGRWWYPTIALYLVFYLVLTFVIDLPLGYFLGYVRQHAYGLSNQTQAKWLSDTFARLAVELLTAVAFAWIPYLLIARSPRRWWLYTALLTIPFLFASVFVKPIWIDPLFNDFGPMKDKQLEQSILNLASRAGIEGSRVFEVNKSVDTKTVNAYVTGFLETKRIVLWDTLIARLKEPEVLVVMAHEMGHYVLGHVVRSILLSSLITVTGLFLVDRLGRWLITRCSGTLGFTSLSDIASVPILLLSMQISSIALTPVAYSYSRHQEHEADRFALDLTHANRAAATAFVKLQAENLGNPRPGWVYRVFRATHPSIGERIDFCNSYRPGVNAGL